jgi:hypothetical protein
MVSREGKVFIVKVVKRKRNYKKSQLQFKLVKMYSPRSSPNSPIVRGSGMKSSDQED